MQQNRQDGLKSVDYNVQAYSCTFQGNNASAVRLCKQGSADFEVYQKTRNNDNDIMGAIVMGPNSLRYKYKLKVDSSRENNVAFKLACKEVKQQIYQDMIQLNNLSALADNRAAAGMSS